MQCLKDEMAERNEQFSCTGGNKLLGSNEEMSTKVNARILAKEIVVTLKLTNQIIKFQVFRTLGVSEEEIELMMTEADINGDGEIDFEGKSSRKF